jgi:hypothetical protein
MRIKYRFTANDIHTCPRCVLLECLKLRQITFRILRSASQLHLTPTKSETRLHKSFMCDGVTSPPSIISMRSKRENTNTWISLVTSNWTSNVTWIYWFIGIPSLNDFQLKGHNRQTPSPLGPTDLFRKPPVSRLSQRRVNAKHSRLLYDLGLSQQWLWRVISSGI